jgi:hypothetical protein
MVKEKKEERKKGRRSKRKRGNIYMVSLGPFFITCVHNTTQQHGENNLKV